MTVAGRLMDAHSLLTLRWSPVLAAAFKVSSPVSSASRAALRLRMGTLYVSLKHVRNSTSQTVASRALIHRTWRHPRLWAMAPAMAGPMAPPISGATMMKLIGDPRCSDTNMSPTMAGLSTLDATATPFRHRAATNSHVLWLRAARTMAAMKRKLAAFMTG